MLQEGIQGNCQDLNDDDNESSSVEFCNTAAAPLSAELVLSRTVNNSSIAVATPVVYQVEIDSERDGNSSRRDLPMGEDVPKRNNNNEDNDNGFCIRSRRNRIWIRILCAVILALILALVLWLVSGSSSDADGSSSVVAGGPKLEPFECYTNTFDIFNAQVEAFFNKTNNTLQIEEEENEESYVFRICPNTTIDIGTFRNPVRGDFNFTNGDFPLLVIRPNVTVQCGLNGDPSDNCVLDGGLSHLVTQFAHGHPKYGMLSYPEVAESIDGMTIRGITFRGDFEPSGPFGGVSIALSHPALDVKFEDCVWKDIAATKRLITVGRNYLMELLNIPLLDLSIEVTFTNCKFENIQYEEDFIASYQQAIHIKNSVFRNIKLSPLLSSGCGIHPNGCRALLHCFAGDGPNVCSISNICVDNMDVAGAGPIIISQDTEWSNTGSNVWIGPIEYDGFLPSFANASSATTAPIPEFAPLLPENPPNQEQVFGPFCSLGVAQIHENNDDQGGSLYACLENPVFEVSTTGTCPT